VGAEPIGGTREKGVSRRPRGVLQGPLLRARESRHIDSLRDERHPDPSCQGGAERLVGVRIRAAELVIEVRRARHLDDAFVLERTQDQQQRDGIRAARKRDENPRAGRTERLPLDRTSDAREEIHTVGELVNW